MEGEREGQLFLHSEIFAEVFTYGMKKAPPPAIGSTSQLATALLLSDKGSSARFLLFKTNLCPLPELNLKSDVYEADAFIHFC